MNNLGMGYKFLELPNFDKKEQNDEGRTSIAKNLKQQAIAVEDIAKATGLSIQEVELL